MREIIALILATSLVWISPSTTKDINSSFEQENECNIITSCSSCIRKSQCTWCVTKSRCTKQTCGNDNVIYPSNVYALMSGPQFCPKIVQPGEVLTLRSGHNESITVPLTQIHLYMAYTTWKCGIHVGEFHETVPASLTGANVRCGSVLLSSESDELYVNGSITVVWDNNKNFDGSFPFKLCRCDLDADCAVCKNEND